MLDLKVGATIINVLLDDLEVEIERRKTASQHKRGERFAGVIYLDSLTIPIGHHLEYAGMAEIPAPGKYYVYNSGEAFTPLYKWCKNIREILMVVPDAPDASCDTCKHEYEEKVAVPEWLKDGWYVKGSSVKPYRMLGLTGKTFRGGSVLQIHIERSDGSYDTIDTYKPATLDDLAVLRKGVKLWAYLDGYGDMEITDTPGDNGDRLMTCDAAENRILNLLWDGPIIPHDQWVYLTK